MKKILYSIIFCVISFTTLLAQDSVTFAFRSHNTRSGLFLSTNNGTNWLSIYNGLPANCSVLTCVVNDTNLFVGTDGCGVFLSTNNGTSWTSVNSGLTNTECLCTCLLRDEISLPGLMEASFYRPTMAQAGMLRIQV